jgi:hypothetical protein
MFNPDNISELLFSILSYLIAKTANQPDFHSKFVALILDAPFPFCKPVSPGVAAGPKTMDLNRTCTGGFVPLIAQR